jgi:hypothetical protein
VAQFLCKHKPQFSLKHKQASRLFCEPVTGAERPGKSVVDLFAQDFVIGLPNDQ